MQVQRISFTSENKSEQSSLYSKKGYMQLVNTTRFSEGLLGGFAIGECIDKFQLIKNKKNLPAKELKAKAWKHTKLNILAGIIAGIGAILIGKVLDKKLMPLNEKLWDATEKQRAINEKAKELVEQEKAQKTEVPKETKTTEKETVKEAKETAKEE